MKFLQLHIEALLRCRETSFKWDELTEDIRQTYLDIDTELRNFADKIQSNENLSSRYKCLLTSGFNRKSGVRNWLPKDLWCSIISKDPKNVHKMPQVFIIVSYKGIEIGFCASIHPSSFSNQAVKNNLRENAPAQFDKLPAPNSNAILNLQKNIDSDVANWFFRKKERLEPFQNDFMSLEEWIRFLKSDQGKQWCGGTISRYFTKNDLNGFNFSTEMLSALKLFEPLMNVYSDSSVEQTDFPKVWIEKTIVKGRPDREGGSHALGKALWSPQKDRRGGDIYSNMRDVKPGDIILHLTDNKAFSTVTIANSEADVSFVGLDGTPWEGQKGYRISLKGQKQIEPAFTRNLFLEGSITGGTLLKILEKHTRLFYNKKLELNQGAYLTKAPIELVHALDKAYFDEFGKHLPYLDHLSNDFSAEEEEPDKAEHMSKYPEFDEKYYTDFFLEKDEIKKIYGLLLRKKNIILQGPPGVGKTFFAKRLVNNLTNGGISGEKEDIQFHSSYSYEDFMQGIRPNKVGGFEVKDGLFKEFCTKALGDSENPYVFIIDEINRGNLSKVLGEAMMLLEADKRESKWAIKLAYQDRKEKGFYIPENVFVIGTMNTADRSIALVDYALRRRFGFVNLKPQFDSIIFQNFLKTKLFINVNLANRIVEEMSWVNSLIQESPDLGKGFLLGHSYFCPNGNQTVLDETWYSEVLEHEILPLLTEYFFDEDDRVNEISERLLG